ncbi:MAG: hypothetical protein WAU88_13790 [Candidatus Zixiibacteriota bacterium]
MRRISTISVLLLLAAAGLLLSQTSTQNPHGKLSQDCQDCHTAQSWSAMRSPMNFNHDATGFSLVGAHATAACVSCHKDLQFSHVGTSCIDCHSDHHNGQVGQSCQNCHTPKDWVNRKDQIELHAQKGFPLTGVHAVADCEACHHGQGTQSYAGTPVECKGCHGEAFAATTNPSHMQAGFSAKCETCHHAASGTWTNATYTHKNFVLTGAHKRQECASCHTSGYASTSTNCYSCHQTAFTTATDPNHVNGQFDHNCALCHSTTTWTPATFDHATSSFPLTGAHASVACASCHTTGYSNTPSDCYSCHTADFTSNKQGKPDHVANAFSHTCNSCHTTAAWQPATFNHPTTPFAITGAHTSLLCASCHTVGYNPGQTPSDCYSCHTTDFTSNKQGKPDHIANGFDHNCVTCHTTQVWKPSTFQHPTSPFALTGAHTSVDCASCHTVGYNPGQTPSDCYSCHTADFTSNTAGKPNHIANGFDHNCTTCHSTSVWKPAVFNHATTPFPLTGSHTSVACGACHTVGYLVGQTPNTCYACHKSDYDGSTIPVHSQAGFATTCQTCHSTTNWTSSSWQHPSSPFALTGAHANVQDCKDCHKVGYGSGQTPTDCYSCHTTDFTSNKAGKPDHVANSFDHNCTSCHSINAWTPATFNHSTTPFPLVGSHTSVACAACHTVGYAVGQTPNTCYACHKSDYDGSTNPAHASAGFPTTCQTCHAVTQWTASTWTHPTSPFAITGAHSAITDCRLCHKVGYNPGQTPSDCYSCHTTDFTANKAGKPDHVANGFDHNCITCHSVNAWTPATFNHASTPFPLTGAHTSVACAACHKVGYTVGQTPNTCYACHKSDYDGTNDPAHSAAGFPTTCQTCHSTTNWTSSTWNHSTYFPIASGRHSGFNCNECHTNSQNYAVFECILCHTHSKSTTDSHHRDVNNYQYLSSRCYSCHPRGNS